MRRLWAPVAVLGILALTGCNRGPYPYRVAGNPHNQNPRGTPSDRTGGSRAEADGYGGGGPGETTGPADQEPAKGW